MNEPSALTDGFLRLIEQAQSLEPVPTAVVHPVDDLSLGGALAAAGESLILPILVGPRARIETAAAEIEADISAFEIGEAPHSHAAAERAVQLVREGRAAAIMKGALHTDEVMEALIDPDTGLRTERRMSHVFVMDVPSYPKMLLISDAAIN
ncbi:MAG: enoyl-CoA hydratase, partial [Sphingomonadales bacterium]|nr:enoyl-CoA hydratase [Sphingomonadales bacterium]